MAHYLDPATVRYIYDTNNTLYDVSSITGSYFYIRPANQAPIRIIPKLAEFREVLLVIPIMFLRVF